MNQFKGAIITDKELKHTLAKPVARALTPEQIETMKGAILNVVDVSVGPEPHDYLVYVKTKSGHEFIWDIDGRDVRKFVPTPQRSPFEELMRTLNTVEAILKR